MNERRLMQPGSLLLPPATNWFCSSSVDSREEDRLLVAGAFKSIVLYRIPVGPEAPTVLKSIYHSGSKVLHVRLFPDASHPQFGSFLLASSDLGGVTLYNIETGVASLQHNEHGAGCVHGVCWSISSSSNEVSAVSVGAAGTLVVWNIDLNITRKVYLNPSQRTNVLQAPQPDVTLTLVEPVPGVDNAVVVAAQKVIIIVDIKNGRVLHQLRGHDQPIYCLRWWMPRDSAAVSPFPHASAVNHRAEALRDCSDGAVKTGDGEGNSSYFASSDLGGNVFLWDVDRRRYVYRTQITGSTKGGGGRSYRPTTQHCALAWHDNCLLTNTVAGVIVSLPLTENSAATCVSVNHDSVTTTCVSEPPLKKSSDDWRSSTSSWRSNNVGPDKKSAQENGGNSAELKPQVIHREHSRVVFNLNVIGSTLVSCGHDRNLIGYSLDINKVQFCLPTLGGAVHSIAFDPRDSSWLALGLQEDCVKLVKLNSSPPLRSKLISNGIRGKVLALSWHPKEDGFLLFGTSEGQVGIANVNTGKVTPFSFFHQRPVYKVEWAPAVLANVYPEFTKSLCAYSFGDREIAMRNANVPMADPVKLTKVSSLPGQASEFSFSHDHEYFAIGCQDGSISVYRSSDLAVLVKIVVVRKTIQHLLWKPTFSPGIGESNTSYVLAVASSDSKICLLDLTNTLPEQSKNFDDFQVTATKKNGSISTETIEAETDVPSWQPLIVSTCTRELCGHTSRVVYLSFSLCNPNLLASASYDHTCQVWDSISGEQIGNYRAHLSRLYRVEFSPSEPGLLFSFGEENCVHQWKLADLKDKSPPAKILKVKDIKPKIAVVCENEPKREVIQTKLSSKSDVKPKNAKHNEASSAGAASKRTPTHKSLFPLLHEASCYKRSFNLLSIMCLYEQSKLEEQLNKKAEQLSVEQMLEAAEEDGISSSLLPVALGSASAHYPAVLDALGDAVLDADDPVPSEEHLRTYVNFYGSPDQTAEFLEQQIASHMASKNLLAAAPLQLWRGTSEALVRHAISTKTVTADVVVQALHFSRQLGEVACEAYARQLAAAGDPLTASSYLVMANKVTEAIELLQLHKLYRESLMLAKTRRPCSKELHESIARSFANHCLHEGSLDIAAVLLASLGDASEAAGMLCRRGDPSSLTVGGLLYSREDHPLAQATLLEALRTAGYRGQLDKVLPTVLTVAPQYKWFSLIAATVREITALVAAVKVEDAEGKSRSSSPGCKSSSRGTAVDGKAALSHSGSIADVPENGSVEAQENTRKSSEEKISEKTEENISDHDTLGTKMNRSDADSASSTSDDRRGTNSEAILAEIYSRKTFLVSSVEGDDEDVLQRIMTLWSGDLKATEMTSAHAAISAALSSSLKPSTFKQYVFLLCVEITKMLLCLGGTTEVDSVASSTKQQEEEKKDAVDVEAAATALRSALQLTVDWNRFDQLFEVVHILLPKGVDEPPMILSPLFNCGCDHKPHAAAALLCKLYCLTEHIQRDKRYCTPFVSSVQTSVDPSILRESVTDNDSETNSHNGGSVGTLDTAAIGDNSSEVKPASNGTTISNISSKVASTSCDSENDGTCRDEIISLAREVAEGCGAGDEAKVKRIFDDISTLLHKLNIQ
ncbi:WD40 repeat [Trinorchestia longiramus]|nr:WD40 repeat [Trinorchestia longiramus]